MNVALRTIHAGAFAVLGTVVLPLLALALHARPERARVDTSTIATDPSESKVDPAMNGREIVSGIGLQRREAGFLLRTTSALREPDVLVYADTEASPGPRLRGSARLLGSAIPGRDLEFVTQPSESVIVLYSLGHQAILAVAPLVAAPAEGTSR